MRHNSRHQFGTSTLSALQVCLHAFTTFPFQKVTAITNTMVVVVAEAGSRACHPAYASAAYITRLSILYVNSANSQCKRPQLCENMPRHYEYPSYSYQLTTSRKPLILGLDLIPSRAILFTRWIPSESDFFQLF